MAAQPASTVPTISPAEMQILISRSGLVLNPGQMADLVLAWRQVAGLIAAIPQGRPLADDLALSFRLPPPTAATARPAEQAPPGGRQGTRPRGSPRRHRRPADRQGNPHAVKPARKAAKPVHKIAKPARHGTKPARDGTKPTRKAAMPTGKAATPTRKAATPARVASKAANPAKARTKPKAPARRSRLTRAMKGGAPPFPSIAEAGRLIAAKKLSPVELTRALLARIAAVDPQLNAFLLVTERQALADARAAERAIAAGQARAAAGHPGCLQGHLRDRRRAHHGALAASWPTTCPPQDAETVRRLHAAGRGHAGQAGDPRVRHRRPGLRPAMAAGAQPLGRQALHRRFVVRLGRGGGGGAGAGGAWDRTPAARSGCRRPIAASPG